MPEETNVFQSLLDALPPDILAQATSRLAELDSMLEFYEGKIREALAADPNGYRDAGIAGLATLVQHNGAISSVQIAALGAGLLTSGLIAMATAQNNNPTAEPGADDRVMVMSKAACNLIRNFWLNFVTKRLQAAVQEGIDQDEMPRRQPPVKSHADQLFTSDNLREPRNPFDLRPSSDRVEAPPFPFSRLHS